MAFGNAFFINPAQVAQQAKKFAQQKLATEASQTIVKGFGPKIQAAWIGGDADEFTQDIARKLMPKFTELALAFAGIELNLTKSCDTASAGDVKASKLAGGWSDLVSKIFK